MRRLIPALALLSACTASNPSQDEPGDALLSDAAMDAAPDAAVDAMADATQTTDARPTPDAAEPDMLAADSATPDAMPDGGDCTPVEERCNGVDEDCDGRVDEGFGVGAPCAVGVGSCASAGVVECADGAAICVGDPGMGGAETCNGEDDDCDGVTDEDIDMVPCYDGPAETAEVGACRTGGSACVGGATVCLDQVRPRTELCDGTDADCDGQVDEGCANCGNGTIDPGEACDDGNRDAGDGCAPNCRLEQVDGDLIPGVQRDVPIGALADRGFFLCHQSQFRTAGQSLDDVLAGCPGTDLLIGCRPTGADRLRVAAEGRFEEVTRDVGAGREAFNAHNGVHFYFSRSASWGFAPLGANVFRNTCDVADLENPDRMCWHTQNDTFRGGWRCGTDNRLTESGDFERMIFTRTAEPLGALRGFGHHGECDSFNGCVDAPTCAEAACTHAGLGAPLSWREGRCLDVPDLDCDLFSSVPDALDTEWVPGCNIPVAYDVVCLGGPPPACGDGTVDPGEDCDDGNQNAGDGCGPDCAIEEPIEILVGPQTDVSIGGLTLGGFEICHTETYATQFDAAAVRAQCPGATWIVGCRPVGAARLTVAAMGLQATIFDPVPNEVDGAQVHNNARWYYGENYSFGFAPTEGGLNRNTCDTAGDRAEERLCWHTIERGGWRCGANTRLNDSDAWERVILQTP